MSYCNFVCVLLLFLANVVGQTSQTTKDAPSISSKTKKAVIESALALIMERYLSVDVAQEVQEFIRTKLENGELFYQRTGSKYRLVPLKKNLFSVENLDYFRIELMTDKNGDPTELIGLYDNGLRDPSRKTN